MRLLHLLTLGLVAHHGAATPAGREAIGMSDHHLQSAEPYDNPNTGGQLVPNSWTVILKDGAKKTAAEHAAWATALHEKDPQDLEGVQQVLNWHVSKTYGYAGEFSDRTIEQIRKDKDACYFFSFHEVKDVFQDATVSKPPTAEGKDKGKEHEGTKNGKLPARQHQDGDKLAPQDKRPQGRLISEADKIKVFTGPRKIGTNIGCGVLEQTGAPWGLERISGAPSGRFHFKEKAGEGTFIYVLDTGIDLKHEDLEDRAEFGYDATAGRMKGYNAVQQTREHGTHVASIAAGAKFGVAKNARLIDVKVLREPEEALGLNNFRMLSEGLQWAFDDIVRHKRVGQAVINLSLGAREIGFSCDSISSLITKILDAGIHVVIAAGNEDAAADKFCPAKVQKAMTVGAVDVDYNRWVDPRKKQQGSNWGSHVDIFAPGVQVEAAWAFSRSGSVYMNGTSMAAPHVSGVVASLIAYEGPRPPDRMWKRLEELSQKNKVKNPRGGNNRLLYNGVAG